MGEGPTSTSERSLSFSDCMESMVVREALLVSHAAQAGPVKALLVVMNGLGATIPPNYSIVAVVLRANYDLPVVCTVGRWAR